MGIEREARIISSGRNFFPKGAFFLSTERQGELAETAGYEGLELLPTWRVCWEVERRGELSVRSESVVSLHRDWRFDRVADARIRGKPDWWFQLSQEADWLFPPSPFALKILQKLQKRYKVPVSVAWFEDTKNFSPVMLELWGPAQGTDYKGLLNWVKKDPENHGVVIDTAKFTSWLQRNQIEKEKEKVFEGLLPHVFEVHYRGIMKNGRWGSESKETLEWILKRGYKGRIVVEFGWPDLENPPFSLIREDLGRFKKLHSHIISFVRNL